MAYPILYAVAASCLQKLDEQSYILQLEIPKDIDMNVEKLKQMLTFLPSITETETIWSYQAITIRNFVYDLDYILDNFRVELESGPTPKGLPFLTSWELLSYNLDRCLALLRLQRKENIKSLFTSLSSFVQLKTVPGDFKIGMLPLQLALCVAYCSVYPKGYRIVRETLVNQWMAHGFLEIQTPSISVDTSFEQMSSSSKLPESRTEVSSIPFGGKGSNSRVVGDRQLEDIGNYYFNELLSRGVFVKPMFAFGGLNCDKQTVRVHSCEIHPVIHEEACLIAAKDVLAFDQNEIDILETNATCLAFHKEVTRVNVIVSNPITVLFFAPLKNLAIVDDILKGYWIENLRVIDLVGTQTEELTYLLRRSFKLRYLALSRNAILKSLEMPDHLQTLAVDGCVQLEKLDLPINYPSIRHLYVTSKQVTLNANMRNLQILELSDCKQLTSLSLGSVVALRSLRIYECSRLVSLSDIMGLLLEELVLHNCARLDLNYGTSMKSLPNLHHFEVIGLPILTELPAWLKQSKAVHHILIADCKSLRSTDHLLHLEFLQKLCVYDCPILSIESRVFRSLIGLQLLDIRKCPKLTNTCTTTEGKYRVPFISHIPEVFLDGQRLLNQMVDLSEKNSAALEPLSPSVSALPDLHAEEEIPYFILSSETFKSAICSKQGMLGQEYKVKIPNSWAVLEINNKRVLQEEVKLYCCLFPSHFEFERATLVQLWMANELLQDYEPMEHRNGKYHFKRLLDEKYIVFSKTDVLTGNQKYKINVDKVTEFLNKDPAPKYKDRYALIEDNNTYSYKCKPWHVSVVCKGLAQTLFKTSERFSELRTLLYIHDCGSCLNHIPSNFFQATHSIRALDLSRSHITELPSSIVTLIKLRFLDLSFTLIERIPESIHLLQELQTLKLIGCKHLHKLPKGLKNLSNLRHLHFDVFSQITSMPTGMGTLIKLCTLSGFVVEKDGCKNCNLKELKDMDNLRGKFCIYGLENASEHDAWNAALRNKMHLAQLHLRWNDSKLYSIKDQREASSVLKWIKPNTSLKGLHISYYPGLDLPLWMHDPEFEKLDSVTLVRCENEELSLSWFLHVRYLNIIDMNRVKVIEIWKRSPYTPKFKALSNLSIDGMLNLEIWRLDKDDYSPCLYKLSVKNCPKLAELPFLPSLGSLKHLEISHCESVTSLPDGKLSDLLETLEIDNCPKLKTRCKKEGEDWHKIEHVKNIWIDLKDIRSDHTESSSDYEADYSEDSEYSD